MGIDKKSMSRSQVIQYRLQLMINMVSERNRLIDLTLLASNDQYVRVCGEKYMGVSLNDKSPILGIGKNSNKLDTVVKYLLDKKPNLLSDKDWASKEERRVQAYLIKKALINGNNLNECLGLDNFFDELYFCLDEVSIGDNNHKHPDPSKPQIVRCDLLCVGLIGGKYYPVLIELKYKRQLTRLIEQLENFIVDIQDIENPEVAKLFSKLMVEASGIGDIELEQEFKKVIVWPRSKSPQKSTKLALQRNDIIEVNYDASHEYSDISKWNFAASNVC
jgi:hypothetical protein